MSSNISEVRKRKSIFDINPKSKRSATGLVVDERQDPYDLNLMINEGLPITQARKDEEEKKNRDCFIGFIMVSIVVLIIVKIILLII